MLTTILALLLTNAVTTTPIPIAPCYDPAVLSATFLPSCTTNKYSLQLEGYDNQGQLVCADYITNSYAFPTRETLTLPLVPGATTVRATITGPPNDVTNASLAIYIEPPSLALTMKGTNLVFATSGNTNCYTLQGSTNLVDWQPATNPTQWRFFRLQRGVIWLNHQ